MRRSVLIVISAAVASALGCAGCASSSSRSAPSTTPAPLSSTQVTAATSPPGPSTTAGPTMGFPTNQAAAQHLIDAWRAHDRAGALQGATTAAVDTMLAIPNGSLNVRGCDDGTFQTSSCVYRLLTNQWEIRIDLERRPAGWVVVDVQYSPPTP